MESFIHNAKLAESVGRQDLAYVWQLLSVVMQPASVGYANESMDDAPWSIHPCGRDLLDYM